MQDSPNKLEMIEAVKAFLEDKAMPELKGHTRFHARVAANVLGILARELATGPDADSQELAYLKDLLGSNGTLEELNQRLCDAIREGSITLASKELKQHLIETTINKVSIDQPKYSGLKTAKDKWR